MPMTYSGVVVRPGGGSVPTLQDIALALSRMPRFCGHTRRWWSVLDHSLFVRHLLRNDGASDAVQLAGLLHDAHEALTADVPTDMKNDEMRALQKLLDARLLDDHFPGGYAAFREHSTAVADADRRALLAEARVVGPPKNERLPLERFTEVWGGAPLIKDTVLLRDLVERERLSRVGVLWLNEDNPQVKEFVTEVEALQNWLYTELIS